MREESRPRALAAVAWVLVTVVAVVVGVLAVRTVGDTIRDRGPLGNEVARNAGLQEGATSPTPGTPAVRKEISGDYGVFVVECQGVHAFGIEVRPDTSTGWAIVSYEEGPDDDVDAVFANKGRSAELEVFCNRGTPTLAEIEWNTLPEDD